ncbi:MAG: carbohydrate kinase [Gammaproteobacteria bacterium]|nr:carbohydrate kinase [Gammaproteobacteria bacterium]
MKDKPIPVLFGEVLFDCFDDGSRVLGGAPFNVSWHLQAFGCEPLLISRVGDDPMGRQIRDTMAHWGMTTAGLQKDSAHRTGEVQISLLNGQPTFEILADRAYDHIRGDALPPMNPSLIYQGTLGLRQPDSLATLEQILDRHQAPVFLDVNLRPPWWSREQVESQLDHARWVKINDDELDTLLEGPRELEEKANILMETHSLSLVIVTQGSKGAFSLENSEQVTKIRPIEETPVVDTVGAGDAFAAVCILGLLRGWPQSRTMERAQQFASLLVGQRGATLSDAGRYQRLMERWEFEGQKI